jgi:hypothetical protein
MSAPRYAAVNGLQMYHDVHGDGPPLVLVHGGALITDVLPEDSAIAPRAAIGEERDGA